VPVIVARPSASCDTSGSKNAKTPCPPYLTITEHSSVVTELPEDPTGTCWQLCVADLPAGPASPAETVVAMCAAVPSTTQHDTSPSA
jgi:hypothetical protein